MPEEKDEQQAITTPRGLRRWRTELPNLIDDADLDPYEFRLLVHYYRVGRCYEGTRKTAEKCHMSPAQVSQKRKSLELKGWLSTKNNEEFGTIEIVLTDVWERNFAHFVEVRRLRGEQYRSLSEHPRLPHEQGRLLREHKKELYEEGTLEEELD